jgi:hypothetical protein
LIATVRKVGYRRFRKNATDFLKTQSFVAVYVGVPMTSIEFIFAEIERLRVQIRRQQKDILALQRSGTSTVSAETLLERMRASIDGLCQKRDWMQRESQIDVPSARQHSSALIQ